MAKIKIITDSGSDIPRSEAEKLGVKIVPLKYTFDGETFFSDGKEKTNAEFYEILRQSKDIPKTSQASPSDFEEAYHEALDEGFDTIIVVAMSSKGSGTYQSARLMAEAVKEARACDIEVIDSMAYSYLYGRAVRRAAEMARGGAGKQEIIDEIKRITERMRAFFLVGSLEYLHKGGRLNTAGLVVANLLDIRPVLTVKDGLIAQHARIRGSKRLCQKMTGIIQDAGYALKGTVAIEYTSDFEKAKELAAAVLERWPDAEILYVEIGAVIASHVGPDLSAVIFEA